MIIPWIYWVKEHIIKFTYLFKHFNVGTRKFKTVHVAHIMVVLNCALRDQLCVLVHLKIYSKWWHCCPTLASLGPVTVAHVGLFVLPPSQPMHQPEWPMCPLCFWCSVPNCIWVICSVYSSKQECITTMLQSYNSMKVSSNPILLRNITLCL